MGEFTELSIGVRMKHDIPDEVVDAIEAMVTDRAMDCQGHVPSAKYQPKVQHPLFSYESDRWRWMLHGGGSYYFPAQPHVEWKNDDEVGKCYFLTLRTNIKNYNEEWEKFLDFIAPYIDEDGYIGTIRYNGAEFPDLLFATEDGKIERRGVVKLEPKDVYGQCETR